MTTGTHLLRFVGTFSEVPYVAMQVQAERHKANAFAFVDELYYDPYECGVFFFLTDPAEGDASIAISAEPKEGFERYSVLPIEAGDPAFYEAGEIYYYDRTLHTFYRLLPFPSGEPTEGEGIVYIRRGCNMAQTYFFVEKVDTAEDVITKEHCELLQKGYNADAVWAYTLDNKTFHIYACYKEKRKGTSNVPTFFLLYNTKEGDAFYAKDIDPEEEDVLYYKGVLHKLSTDFITDEE